MSAHRIERIVAIALLAFVTGCAKGDGKWTSSSSPVSANPAAEKNDASRIACSLPPLKEVALQPTEGHVVDLNGHDVSVNTTQLETYGLNLKDPDAYLCGHLKDWKAEEPEEILVIGNQDGLKNFGEHIRFLIKHWNLAAAGSHRRGCLFVLSKKNLNRIAERKNVERIIFLGHGSEGNLLTPIGDSIDPVDLKPMLSTTIKEVRFFSCQAGQKEGAWEKIFAASSSKLDLSKDNISVMDSLDEVGTLIDQIWTCHI